MSMNHFLKSLLVALLVTVSASAATITWTAGATTDEWTTAANWNSGTVPGGADTASVVNGPTPTPVIRSTVTVGTISVGTSGGGTPGTLNIVSGAAITANSTGQNTYYRSGQTTQTGGTFTTNKNTYFATQGTHTYTITGGSWTQTSSTITIIDNSSTSLPANAYIHVYGGSFSQNATGWRPVRTGSGYSWQMDVKDSGRLYMPWSKATTIGYITATTQNLKSGSPTQGLVLSWNTANTFCTAIAKYAMATRIFPLEGAGVPPSTALPLTWIKPLCQAGTEMPVNVRYGEVTIDVNGVMLNPSTGLEDPNGDSLPVVATGLTGTNTFGVLAEDLKNYAWRIETVDPGVPGDANFPAKTYWAPRAYTIRCGNQPPVVTIPTVAAKPIGLRDGTVTWTTTATAADDGLPNPPAARTFVWSQVGGPVVPGLPTGTSSTGAITLTLTQANTGYIFRCTANDSQLEGYAEVTVPVYADRCAAAKAIASPFTPVYVAAPADLNADCWVNFVDMALMLENWVKCNSLDPADVACI